MIDLTNIRSLSEFQRNAKSHIRRLKKTGRPEVLTVNGQAALVIQDATAYQQMLERLEQAKVIEDLRLGLEQARRGEGRPMRQVLEDIADRKGIRLRK